MRQRIRAWMRPPRRLKFHREGKYFVAITIGIGFAAVNTGNNLLYLLLGWLLSVIVASGILSELALRHLTITRHVPGAVHAGRPFLMGVSIANGKSRLPSFSIEVEDLQDDTPLDKKCFFLKVPSGRTQSTSYRHSFARRGLYRVDGVRLSTKFPFSLFRKSRDIDLPGEILVYPAVHPVPVPSRHAASMGEETRASSGRRGEFFGLREFRLGDDRRDVHWRSTARQGRVVVREYEAEAHRRVSLFLDNSLPAGATTGQADELETAISDAASMACAYLERGWAVRLVTRGTQVAWGHGPSHRTRTLTALALLETVPPETGWAAPAEPGGENTLVPRAGAQAGAPPGVRAPEGA